MLHAQFPQVAGVEVSRAEEAFVPHPHLFIVRLSLQPDAAA